MPTATDRDCLPYICCWSVRHYERILDSVCQIGNDVDQTQFVTQLQAPRQPCHDGLGSCTVAAIFSLAVGCN
jgi:hypothetical protein